jgi:hypothetical protein
MNILGRVVPLQNLFFVDKERRMANTDVGKEITSDKEQARPTKDEDVLIVDMDDNADIVLSTKGPKRPRNSKVISCGSKMVGSPKII